MLPMIPSKNQLASKFRQDCAIAGSRSVSWSSSLQQHAMHQLHMERLSSHHAASTSLRCHASSSCRAVSQAQRSLQERHQSAAYSCLSSTSSLRSKCPSGRRSRWLVLHAAHDATSYPPDPGDHPGRCQSAPGSCNRQQHQCADRLRSPVIVAAAAAAGDEQADTSSGSSVQAGGGDVLVRSSRSRQSIPASRLLLAGPEHTRQRRGRKPKGSSTVTPTGSSSTSSSSSSTTRGRSRKAGVAADDHVEGNDAGSPVGHAAASLHPVKRRGRQPKTPAAAVAGGLSAMPGPDHAASVNAAGTLSSSSSRSSGRLRKAAGDVAHPDAVVEAASNSSEHSSSSGGGASNSRKRCRMQHLADVAGPGHQQAQQEETNSSPVIHPLAAAAAASAAEALPPEHEQERQQLHDRPHQPPGSSNTESNTDGASGGGSSSSRMHQAAPGQWYGMGKAELQWQREQLERAIKGPDAPAGPFSAMHTALDSADDFSNGFSRRRSSSGGSGSSSGSWSPRQLLGDGWNAFTLSSPSYDDDGWQQLPPGAPHRDSPVDLDGWQASLSKPEHQLEGLGHQWPNKEQQPHQQQQQQQQQHHQQQQQQQDGLEVEEKAQASSTPTAPTDCAAWTIAGCAGTAAGTAAADSAAAAAAGVTRGPGPETAEGVGSIGSVTSSFRDRGPPVEPSPLEPPTHPELLGAGGRDVLGDDEGYLHSRKMQRLQALNKVEFEATAMLSQPLVQALLAVGQLLQEQPSVAYWLGKDRQEFDRNYAVVQRFRNNLQVIKQQKQQLLESLSADQAQQQPATNPKQAQQHIQQQQQQKQQQQQQHSRRRRGKAVSSPSQQQMQTEGDQEAAVAAAEDSLQRLQQQLQQLEGLGLKRMFGPEEQQ